MGTRIRFDGRAGSGSDFDTDQSRNVYLVPLIAFASLIWHGAVSKACEKVPALAQLKKWSLGAPFHVQVSCLQHIDRCVLPRRLPVWLALLRMSSRSIRA
jgi:hypothetical protein